MSRGTTHHNVTKMAAQVSLVGCGVADNGDVGVQFSIDDLGGVPLHPIFMTPETFDDLVRRVERMRGQIAADRAHPTRN